MNREEYLQKMQQLREEQQDNAKKNRKAMTDEQIIALAEKTRKEKYCVRFDRRYGDCKLKEFPYTRCTMKRTPVCDEWDNLCEGEGYRLGFLDGFKAGYNKGRDSMSDYVMELQHAAYDD